MLGTCHLRTLSGRFLWTQLGVEQDPRRPQEIVPTAEFVESLVIFLYGINTWVERFGAKPGDPYTTRQVQHISITVSFYLFVASQLC